MTVALDKSIKTQKFYFDDLLTKREALADESNDNLKFAWVERVGHAIIERIEIQIGGHKIDRHFGDWLNIWYELSANRDMEDVYFKMIGNVDVLTNFDRVPKPRYLLKIPLQFWFNRFNGLALPLVAMEYHDAIFHVKFRDIEEVSYIEQDKTIQYGNIDGGIFLDEVPEQTGIDIEASMVIDYIYLDSAERRRFAQSSHEYMIEQLQMLEFTNVTKKDFQVVLNNFVHPSKELIWVSQKQRYTQNLEGYTKLRWDNYSLTDANKGNPIAFSSVDFHSYSRVTRLDGNYFNYVQPYETHNTTPSDGINMYSFSLFPEESQPSSAANFSRLARVTLFLEFDASLFPVGPIATPFQNGVEDEALIVRIYTRGLNILRFASGMGGLAFAYG